jgi:hypothetical protein
MPPVLTKSNGLFQLVPRLPPGNARKEAHASCADKIKWIIFNSFPGSRLGTQERRLMPPVLTKSNGLFSTRSQAPAWERKKGGSCLLC